MSRMFGVYNAYRAAAVAVIAIIPTHSVSAADFNYSDRPALTWTGFSIGVHGGYGWADVDFPGAKPYPDGPPIPDIEGGFVGFQGAAMVEYNRFVLGLTADISFANMKDTVRDGNYLTETTKLDRFGTVRGVFGYSFGRFLPYATVGLGWANGSYGGTCADAGTVLFGGCRHAGPRSYNDSFTMTGIAWGAGVKYAIDDHWSVSAEYVRISFDDESFTNGPLASWAAKQAKISADYDSARVTVDYRF